MSYHESYFLVRMQLIWLAQSPDSQVIDWFTQFGVAYHQVVLITEFLQPCSCLISETNSMAPLRPVEDTWVLMNIEILNNEGTSLQSDLIFKVVYKRVSFCLFGRPSCGAQAQTVVAVLFCKPSLNLGTLSHTLTTSTTLSTYFSARSMPVSPTLLHLPFQKSLYLCLLPVGNLVEASFP